MAIPKNIISRLILLFEIMFFITYCFYSPSGIPQYLELKNMNAKICAEIQGLENSIVQLAQEIHQWETNPFYKEKKAREQLQMAQPNEEVIFIKNIKGIS